LRNFSIDFKRDFQKYFAVNSILKKLIALIQEKGILLIVFLFLLNILIENIFQLKTLINVN
jgi:hypothetical protein